MKVNILLKVIKEFWGSTLIFILFVLFTIVYAYINKVDKTDDYLKTLQNVYNTQFNITYKHFRNLSQNTFYGIINKPTIFENVKLAYNKPTDIQEYYRNKLYKDFLADYDRLKSFKFKQLHFHFPDNTSFLRMHRPNKFGDDLTAIRKSVVWTNKTLKPTEGFEVGKAAFGFRFVFPLHDEKLFHIGSVETSVSTTFFDQEFDNNYDSDVHFLVKKELCENKMYKKDFDSLHESDENKDYVFYENEQNELYHFTSHNFYTLSEKKFIKEKMANAEDFYISRPDKSLVIHFMSIKNVIGDRNSAYMVIYTKTDVILDLNRSYRLILFGLGLLTILFIMFISSRYKNLLVLKRKEEIIIEQSKLASMGEMIGNISHQWRQPLSVISTSASGLKIQKEFGVLDDKTLVDSLENIVSNSMYLSETIEDFRNFFHEDSEKKPFYAYESINKVVLMFEKQLEEKNIELIKDYDTSLDLLSYEEDFKQVISVFIKNSMEAINKDGVIIVSVEMFDDDILISIQDSGGGIDEKIKDKIFEPYFTTKHKNIGTGLGLYMAYETVNRNLNGTITLENKDFTYKFKNLTGVCVMLKLKRNNYEN